MLPITIVLVVLMLKIRNVLTVPTTVVSQKLMYKVKVPLVKFSNRLFVNVVHVCCHVVTPLTCVKSV